MSNPALNMLGKLSSGERAFVGAVVGGFVASTIEVSWLVHKYNKLVKEHNDLAERARTGGKAFDMFATSTAYLIKCLEDGNIVLDDFDYIAMNEMMREVKQILDKDTDFNGHA